MNYIKQLKVLFRKTEISPFSDEIIERVGG